MILIMALLCDRPDRSNLWCKWLRSALNKGKPLYHLINITLATSKTGTINVEKATTIAPSEKGLILLLFIAKLMARNAMVYPKVILPVSPINILLLLLDAPKTL